MVDRKKLAHYVTDYFRGFPQVTAIGIGGSVAQGQIDKRSDVDIYIFTESRISLEFRQKLAEMRQSPRANIGLHFWDDGDEWYDGETGIEVDLIYWDKTWIEDQIDRTVLREEAWVGYTTCFWHTVKNLEIMYDRDDWLKSVRVKCQISYPSRLKKSIIEKNFVILRDIIPSYCGQIEKAVERHDLVSVNHRLAAFLASYFDVLFAMNEIPHPGEKKQISFIKEHCAVLPENWEADIEELLLCPPNASLIGLLNQVVDSLETCLKKEGFEF